MIARTLIAIGVLLSAIDLTAQAADAYLRLVRMYRTDPSAAIVAMARLNSEAIDEGVRRCVPDDTSVQPMCRRAQPDKFLGELTEATGGRTSSARSERQLEELFGRALDEMRARYLLTYTPSGPEKPGWHEIKVSLKGARGDVIAKQGYFVR